jgi:hypothetical protein
MPAAAAARLTPAAAARRDQAARMPAASPSAAAIHVNMRDRTPITAPHHGWFTSPARSHADVQKGKELPLHLVALILSYVGPSPPACYRKPPWWLLMTSSTLG